MSPTSRTTTIPYTPTEPGWSSVRPRPLGPIRLHPDTDTIPTPALPSPPRHAVFHTTAHGEYRLSTHLVPAAYPRLAPDIPLPVVPAYTPDESPAERRNKLDVLAKQLGETQEAYHAGTLGGRPNDKPLWNCVNRFARTSGSSTGLTLFLAHANGFHKETWETMLRGLLDAPAGETIDEVWAWDAVQHGDATVVNDQNLSGIFDWLDNSRDVVNFLLYHLPDDVAATTLPTRLPRLPASVTRLREERGYHTRKLVVVGHSFGGCTSARVAIDFPKLFSSIVLVDPVIHRRGTYRPGHLHKLVLGALTRRDRWSSREEVLRLFQRSPFFGAWHPDVLRLYVEHALIDDPDGGVRLKMSGLQEGLSFANMVPAVETWELLDQLDHRITLRWIVPDNPLSTKEMTYERVWRRPANSTNIVFHFAGHLIVQEAPLELAYDISDFLLREYSSTRPRL